MGRITTRDIRAMKERGEKIAMLTAYDYSTARLLDEAGVPVLLVGDSLGMVMLGYDTTLPVTMEDMLHHVRAVVRGSKRAHVVADMPFLSYQTSPEDALRNAGRLLQEGGAQSVKLEGGAEMAPTVRRLVSVGIPVMGHLGFTPQSVHQFGGYRVQGRSKEAALRLISDALALEEAGVYAIVLEMVPAHLARLVTERVRVPTIGIGAGPYCDGQVQVVHDMLGLYPDFTPKHAKQYARLGEVIRQAVTAYMEEVRQGAFPTEEHSHRLDPSLMAEIEALAAAL
ncbi:3-methyl-2-oxobutanoate hydroxymethyltransferase [bacterium HR25]|jgi:3-methyl-2-oxobutanoate hydroxymethyltransferase|nr:3-methyl-2-oxobutanoate hydroxymethyltransferase [bacterium HR25]